MALRAAWSSLSARSMTLPVLAKLPSRPGCGKSTMSGALLAVDRGVDGRLELLGARVLDGDARLVLEVLHRRVELDGILVDERAGGRHRGALELAGQGALEERAGAGRGRLRPGRRWPGPALAGRRGRGRRSRPSLRNRRRPPRRAMTPRVAIDRIRTPVSSSVRCETVPWNRYHGTVARPPAATQDPIRNAGSRRPVGAERRRAVGRVASPRQRPGGRADGRPGRRARPRGPARPRRRRAAPCATKASFARRARAASSQPSASARSRSRRARSSAAASSSRRGRLDAAPRSRRRPR